MTFPIEKFEDIQARPGDFRLLEKMPLDVFSEGWPIQLSDPVGDEKSLIILDSETTGFKADEESLIELGLVEVSYSPSAKRIVSVDRALSRYKDPKKPIPEIITRLTGITDEKVIGQDITLDEVKEWVGEDTLVVAHNAKFDRPFFESTFPELGDLAWACSMTGIDWKGLGYESVKLEYILLRLGYFYEGHRAAVDCLAVAWLLHSVPGALEKLIESSTAEQVKIRAFGSPFAVKDILKKRDYEWDDGTKGSEKCWWTTIDKKDLEEEQKFLDELYKDGSTKAHYEEIDAYKRFKAS